MAEVDFKFTLHQGMLGVRFPKKQSGKVHQVASSSKKNVQDNTSAQQPESQINQAGAGSTKSIKQIVLEASRYSEGFKDDCVDVMLSCPATTRDWEISRYGDRMDIMLKDPDKPIGPNFIGFKGLELSLIQGSDKVKKTPFEESLLDDDGEGGSVDQRYNENIHKLINISINFNKLKSDVPEVNGEFFYIHGGWIIKDEQRDWKLKKSVFQAKK